MFKHVGNSFLSWALITIVKSTTVRTTLKQDVRATSGRQDLGTGPRQ